MDSPCATACAVGCPIRTSEDHRALAPPLGFSQRATSFIASRYQGIHQMPFSCCARAQPQTRKIRGQMTEDRCQTIPADLLAPSGAVAPTAAPCRCSRTGSTHTHAPGSNLTPRGDGRTCFTVTTRFTISTEQRTEDGRQTTRSITPTSVPTRGPDARRRAQRLSVSLFSVPGHLHLVGLGRVERPTSRLSGVRSDQLSYRPKVREQTTDDRGQTRRSGVSRAAHVGSVL